MELQSQQPLVDQSVRCDVGSGVIVSNASLLDKQEISPSSDSFSSSSSSSSVSSDSSQSSAGRLLDSLLQEDEMSDTESFVSCNAEKYLTPREKERYTFFDATVSTTTTTNVQSGDGKVSDQGNENRNLLSKEYRRGETQTQPMRKSSRDTLETRETFDPKMVRMTTSDTRTETVPQKSVNSNSRSLIRDCRHHNSDDASCASDIRSTSSSISGRRPLHMSTDRRDLDRKVKLAIPGTMEYLLEQNRDKAYTKNSWDDDESVASSYRGTCSSNAKKKSLHSDVKTDDSSNSRRGSRKITESQPFRFATDGRCRSWTTPKTSQLPATTFHAKPAPNFSLAHAAIKDRPEGKQTVKVKPFNFATDKRAGRLKSQHDEKSIKGNKDHCNPQTASISTGSLNRKCAPEKVVKKASGTEPKPFKFLTEKRAKKREVNLVAQSIATSSNNGIQTSRGRKLPTVTEYDEEDSSCSRCSGTSTVIGNRSSASSIVSETGTLKSRKMPQSHKPSRSAEYQKQNRSNRSAQVTVAKPFAFVTDSRLTQRKKSDTDIVEKKVQSVACDDHEKRERFVAAHTTEPHPFYFRTNERAAAGRTTKRKSRIRSAEEIELEECEKQFHALPTPKAILDNTYATPTKFPVPKATLKYHEIQPHYLTPISKAVGSIRDMKSYASPYVESSTQKMLDLNTGEPHLTTTHQKGSPTSVMEDIHSCNDYKNDCTNATIVQSDEVFYDTNMHVEKKTTLVQKQVTTISTGLSFDELQAEWTNLRATNLGNKLDTLN